MEHKFPNIQIIFDFLSVLELRDHSRWRAKKKEHGEAIMLIRTFALNVINNERKKLTHHEIIDCIAEQTASVIIQASKESKFIRTDGSHVSHLLIYSNLVINVLQEWLSIIVMNDIKWVKNNRLLKAIHF